MFTRFEKIILAGGVAFFVLLSLWVWYELTVTIPQSQARCQARGGNWVRLQHRDVCLASAVLIDLDR